MYTPSDFYRNIPTPSYEKDPFGKSPHEKGAKLDAGKPRPGLVLGSFALALAEVVDIGTLGAKKYTDNGWIDVPDGINRYEDAAGRHRLKRQAGEKNDVDTKKKHLSHEAWNILAQLELVLREERDGLRSAS